MSKLRSAATTIIALLAIGTVLEWAWNEGYLTIPEDAPTPPCVE